MVEHAHGEVGASNSEISPVGCEEHFGMDASIAATFGDGDEDEAEVAENDGDDDEVTVQLEAGVQVCDIERRRIGGRG